jgi:hypothetical protein
MTTTIRRDYDPERDRCEDALAEHEASREEERKAWARFVTASVDMAAAQMLAAVGLTHETLGVYQRAGTELEAATEALKLCGVDVTKYLEAT